MQALPWIFLAASTWTIFLLSTDKRRFQAFWTGGLWSVALAMLAEASIRSRIGYFAPERLLVPLFGTELLNFFGPRYVEGVLFMQRLRPTLQLTQAMAWAAGILIAEMALAITGTVRLSWQGIGLAAAVHTFRFLSLLGIYGALDYDLRRARLTRQSTRATLVRLALLASRGIWPLSWPLFGLGAKGALKLAQALDRRTAKARRA